MSVDWPRRVWLIVSGLFLQTWRSWKLHGTQRVGAALAYYTAFSMAPILVIAIALAGLVFGEAAARSQLSEQLTDLMGAAGAATVEGLLASAHQGGGGVLATVLGVFTLLLGASRVFSELQSALNMMWGAPPSPHVGWLTEVRTRFLSFAMVLVIGFLLLVSLVLSALISGFQGLLGGPLPIPLLASALNFSLSFGVSVVLFALIYKVLPDVHVAWRDVGVGAAVTALLFSVGKMLIGMYLGNSTLASAYGAAGSFVVMLVWLYYSTQIILFGAEFTHVYAHREGSKRGEPPSPAEPGTGSPPQAPGPSQRRESAPT